MNETPMITPPLGVQSRRSDGRTTVDVTGEIDFTTAKMLLDGLAEAARQSVGPLSVDMRDVGFIDSSGLGVLVTTHRRLKSEGRVFTVIVSPESQPDRVLTLGRFATFLNMSHESPV